jgi:putative membrane protein insertion efficiency factor
MRPLPTRIAQRSLMALVRGYRFFLSPWLGSACRFEPSCSAYSLRALEAHGAAAGTYLTLRRIARCQPWCEGGHDPVPTLMPRLFAWRRGAARVAAEVPTQPSTGKTLP